MARTYQCWDCGRTVEAENVQRVEVSRWGRSYGRGGPRVYTRTQRVNLCPDCRAKHERRNNVWAVVGLLVVAAVVLYFLVIR